jgi:hypothetical protein
MAVNSRDQRGLPGACCQGRLRRAGNSQGLQGRCRRHWDYHCHKGAVIV